MKLTSLLSDIEYKPVNGGDIDIEITSIAADSRKVIKGCLFFCFKRINFDPHDILNEIEESGAAAIVIDREIETSGVSVPVIKVKNSRSALSIAAAKLNSFFVEQLFLIGITGTNGKTSTSYFIESVLREAKKKTGVIGTVGVKVCDRDLGINFTAPTTPDTLELMDIFKSIYNEGADSVVMEVSSHALALNKVDGLRFKTGVFTNLTQDHLDFHKTMDDYFSAKAKLFNQCDYGVINIDDPWGKKLADSCGCKTLTYGLEPECGLRALNVKNTSQGVSYDLTYLDSTANIFIPIPGRFTVYNSLAAIGAGLTAGIPLNIIIEGISKVQSIRGRIQSIPNDRDINVIVDYAHTPDGISEIIKSVREFSQKRIITVFGCGGDRDRAKRPIMGEIAGRLSDYCIITSDNPRSENPIDIINEIENGLKLTGCKYEKIEDRKKAIYKALEIAQKYDSVIIAGKGHEDYQELKDEIIHFDDVSVVREALESF